MTSNSNSVPTEGKPVSACKTPAVVDEKLEDEVNRLLLSGARPWGARAGCRTVSRASNKRICNVGPVHFPFEGLLAIRGYSRLSILQNFVETQLRLSNSEC